MVASKLSPGSAIANPMLIVNLNSVNSGHPLGVRRHLSGPSIFWVSRIRSSESAAEEPAAEESSETQAPNDSGDSEVAEESEEASGD